MMGNSTARPGAKTNRLLEIKQSSEENVCSHRGDGDGTNEFHRDKAGIDVTVTRRKNTFSA